MKRFRGGWASVLALVLLLSACGTSGQSIAIPSATSPTIVPGATTEPVDSIVKPTLSGPVLESSTTLPTLLTRVPAAAPTATLSSTRPAPAGGLAFRSLGQAAPTNAEPQTPMVYIAASANELAPFAQLLTEEHQQLAGSVDYTKSLVLAVFSGAVGASGSTMTVEQIRLDGGKLLVVANRRDPQPGENVLAVFTSPYHLVELSRAELGGIPASWTLVNSQGDVMATGSFG